MPASVPAAVAALPDPEDQRRLHGWASAVTELAGEPEPLVGDPGFDLWPALDTGWEKLHATGDAPRAVRRRFDLLTQELGLDRRRAAGWTLAQLLQNTLWDIEGGRTTIDPSAAAATCGSSTCNPSTPKTAASPSV